MSKKQHDAELIDKLIREKQELKEQIKKLKRKVKTVACESYCEGVDDAEYMGDRTELWGESISYHTHFRGLPLDTYKDNP